MFNLLFGAIIALSSQAAIQSTVVNYKYGEKQFEGYVAFPKGASKKLPAVLVVHDWLGVTEKTKTKVDQLAELGYLAFAADIYGQGVRPKDPGEAGKLAGSFKNNRTLYREHLHFALQEMLKNPLAAPEKTAVIGFCFGGTGAIELARSGANIKAAVSFHGGLDSPSPQDGKNIKAKVLALHGADDPFVKAVDLKAFEEEMKTNNVDYKLIQYPGAVHSFTDKTAGNDNSKGAAYNESADQKSWIAMKDLFSTLFK